MVWPRCAVILPRTIRPVNHDPLQPNAVGRLARFTPAPVTSNDRGREGRCAYESYAASTCRRVRGSNSLAHSTPSSFEWRRLSSLQGETRILVDVGRQLRRAREDAGLTLRAVRERSGDLFKPSAVGAYERGERGITLERFCDICRFYGVGPQIVLAKALEREEPPSSTVGDVKVVRAAGHEEHDVVVLDPAPTPTSAT